MTVINEEGEVVSSRVGTGGRSCWAGPFEFEDGVNESRASLKPLSFERESGARHLLHSQQIDIESPGCCEVFHNDGHVIE